MKLRMQQSSKINDFLESISELSVEDQLILSDIIRKRAIEERRNKLALSIKESEEEYFAGKTRKGNVDDFLTDIDS